MMLDDLADALRSGGLTVLEVAGWRTRGHGPMEGVRGVVCHHTAGPPRGDSPSLGVVVSGRDNLPGPLAHLFLSRSGVWHTVAAGIAWHAGKVIHPGYGNQWRIGIEAEATGVDAWPDEQYASYVDGCRILSAHYLFPVEQIVGHKEVCDPPGRKIDPNFDMGAFRRSVASGSRSGQREENIVELTPEALSAVSRAVLGARFGDGPDIATMISRTHNAVMAARVPTAEAIADAVAKRFPAGSQLDVSALAGAVRDEFARRPLQ